MATLHLDDVFEEIPLLDDSCGILHTIRVDQFEYGIWYIPLSAGFLAQKEQIESQLGRRLPANCYEVKFALKRDFEDGVPGYTTPGTHGDLGCLNYRQMMVLGKGIFQSSWMLRGYRDVRGFVAVALEDRPQLGSYYGRLLKNYRDQLGYSIYPVLEGSGYAIF
jgi:hypothetical protein